MPPPSPLAPTCRRASVPTTSGPGNAHRQPQGQGQGQAFSLTPGARAPLRSPRADGTPPAPKRSGSKRLPPAMAGGPLGDFTKGTRSNARTGQSWATDGHCATASVATRTSAEDATRARDSGTEERGPGEGAPAGGGRGRGLRAATCVLSLIMSASICELDSFSSLISSSSCLISSSFSMPARRRRPLGGRLRHSAASSVRLRLGLSVPGENAPEFEKGVPSVRPSVPDRLPPYDQESGRGARALALAGRAPRRPAQPGCGCARCGPGPAAASPSALALSLSRAHVPGNTAGSLPSLSSGFGWEGDEQL